VPPKPTPEQMAALDRLFASFTVEVAFNDLQESPQYPGGLALRFARVKGYREDKSAAEADTMATVRAIHAAQAARSESDVQNGARQSVEPKEEAP